MDISNLPQSSDPEQALATVVALRRLADKLERESIAVALGLGWTWADIAEALGVTRQAAHKRLAPFMRHDNGEQE
jgi:DNA-directed RNA polymerase specialized sigma24 family protein